MSEATRQQTLPTQERIADDRPADCCCWNPETDLPCWPCYEAGFDTQNPEAPEADSDD